MFNLRFKSHSIHSSVPNTSNTTQAILGELSQRELTQIQSKLSPILDQLEQNQGISSLSSKEVAQKTAEGNYNRPLGASTRSTSTIVRQNIFTLFNILNAILAIIVIFAAFLNPRNLKNLTFFFVVLCNLAIGIYQELKAKRSVDALRIRVAPRVIAWRDAKLVSIPSEEIVTGDILYLQSGDLVPVDGRCIYSDGLEADESLLTGESDALEKSSGSDIYSGSSLVAGRALIQVTQVGEKTVAAKLSKIAQGEKRSRSELKKSLNRIIQAMSILIIPIGLLLFASQYFRLTDQPLDVVIVACVAALVGMIPEGLVLMTEIAFAVGTENLARQDCLVQTMPAMEMLARLDTLCLDKTGTLTDGSMKVIDLIPLQDSLSDTTTATSSSPSHAAERKEELHATYEDILRELMSVTSAKGGTQSALQEAFPPKTILSDSVTRVIQFSSSRKWSGVQFEARGTYLLGAAEFILDREAFSLLASQIERESDRGYRVLLLAHSQAPFSLDQKDLRPQSIQPLALITLEDHIREDAPATLNYFREQGVTLKLISGDNPKTLSAIAARAGFPNAKSVVDMSALQEDVSYGELVQKHALFARSNPYQKRELLAALQAQGHTVGMTGDGVNDVPALKEADCSIAMAAGSEAARGSSDIVLMNNQMSSLVQAVYEGRRVINNIERVASLFLVKTIYSMLLSLIYIVLGSAYPVIPIQMAIVSSLTIGIPAFFLALKPNRARVTGHFLEKVLSKALPPALTAVFLILCLEGLSAILQMSHAQRSTVTFIILLTLGFATLYRVSKPLTLARFALILGLALTALILLLFFSKLLAVETFLSTLAFIYVPFACAALPLSQFIERCLMQERFNPLRHFLKRITQE